MKPSVGRIVHYVSYGTPGGEHPSVCRAAVITEVPQYLTAEPFDGCPNGTDGQWIAGLAVLNPEGFFFNRGVPYTTDGTDPGDPECIDAARHAPAFGPCACGWSERSRKGGTWHWPERES
ncbi:hypothetical protein [Streptomyces sp. OK228]|uniref:hypothetical protein n=1 Tax=Streptomyces sp. OK228 TaxID=1882786 RepID=UPI000BD6EF79|nr:hypothetical protein [Streptomyces sp. OK228]SOE25656.1 hypothetical protein SAMN05442782_2399 [Streptomyces sp. OK228]